MLKLLLPIITAIADHENATPEQLARMTEDEVDREVKICEALGILAVFAQVIDPANLEYWRSITDYTLGQILRIKKLRDGGLGSVAAMQAAKPQPPTTCGPKKAAVEQYDPELVESLFRVHDLYQESLAKAPAPVAAAAPVKLKDTPEAKALLMHVLKTLPDSLSDRRNILLGLFYALPKSTPAWHIACKFAEPILMHEHNVESYLDGTYQEYP